MRKKSEERMGAIVKYIEHTYFESGRAPSLSEIGAAVGLSKGMVSQYLDDMETRGMLRREAGYYGTRTRRMEQERGATASLPLVGEIACGAPLLAEENIEGYLTFSRSMLGAGEFFLLRAKGDSMIGAGIEDGDTVIVRRQSTASAGEIVVALLEDEATLKRLLPSTQEGVIRLHAENPSYADILCREAQIQGVAVKVMKDL